MAAHNRIWTETLRKVSVAKIYDLACMSSASKRIFDAGYWHFLFQASLNYIHIHRQLGIIS